MSFNWGIIHKKLYGILGARGRGMEKMTMYNPAGNETIDPTDANRFFATFNSDDPSLETFTVLAAIRDEGQSSHIDVKTPDLKNKRDFKKILKLVMAIREGIGNREGIKINWQIFDKEIDPREEAVNNIKESKDVGRFFGTTKSSFQRIGNAKLIIRHTESINEEKHGARTRHIRAIFVENLSGERFAYPHLHMTGARAFARHISNGGKNHDTVATKIFSLSEDYIGLRSARQSLRMHGNDNDWTSQLKTAMEGINRQLKSLQGPKGYASAAETILGESESAVIDEQLIGETHKRMAEVCSCEEGTPLYAVLGNAARYITGMPRMTEPMVFAWAHRPVFQPTSSDSLSERLQMQIMELSRACATREMSERLASIAEMISHGHLPADDEMDLVKEAFASSMRDHPAQQAPAIPEEMELTEFLMEFDLRRIFS